MAGDLLPLPKRCGKCREVKPDTEFHMRGRRAPGQTSSFCKECAKAIARQHRLQAIEEAEASEGWKRWRYATKDNYLRAIDGRHKFVRKYGISVEDYFDLLERQCGKCGICERMSDDRNMAVDHCHETGAVRGLLCSDCNLGIGQLGDTIEGLERALAYLKRVSA